jgi:spermidine synthase
MPILHGLFFVSGAAGLVYEVIWVRQLGNVFGNTVYSASLVTAVFMAGLGGGSYFAGGWADRRVQAAPNAPLRAYGVAELVIAAMAVLLAFLLPRLAPIAARVAMYAPDGSGFYDPSWGSLAIRYATATVLLSLPTMAMGATFTLLVRYALRSGIEEAGWKVGALYGINTAGAAGGACLTDLALVPAIGLLRTQLVAALAQVVVGVTALLLTARAEAPCPNPQPAVLEEDEARENDAARSGSALRAASLTLFLSGFAALGMELVWFRSLSVALGSFRLVFSLILALLLCGIWLGSLAGGAAQRLWGRPVQILLVTQGLFVLTSLGLVVTFTRPEGSAEGVALKAAAYIVAVPAFLMGFSTPLAHAIVQDAVGQVGRRTGALYLANTAGAVAGSLFAGFVLAPWLGTQASFLIMAACAAVAPVPLVFAASPRTRSLAIALTISAGLSVPAMAAWLALPPFYLLSRFLRPIPRNEQVLTLQEGVNEVVVVTETEDGSRRLMTNGHPMSGTQLLSQRYMRSFAHIPLLMMDNPTSALVICFGVGSTLNAASLHRSLERIDLADLSRNVLDHASYFRAANHDVLHDPRVRVAVNDGRQHLQMQPESAYDLVTLEPPPINFAGVSALYSREFYELAKSRLKPGGMITQWLPAYQTTRDKILAMVKAFIEVFPESALLSGSGTELVLIGTTGPKLTFDLDRVEAKLLAEPRVAEDLARVDLGTLTELVGTFAGDAGTLRRATEGVLPLTDDRPSLEYNVLWYMAGKAALIPSSVFNLDALPDFCPKCFDSGIPDPRVAGLDAYEKVLARLYKNRDFLGSSRVIELDTSDGVKETIARSKYLRELLGVTPPFAATP